MLSNKKILEYLETDNPIIEDAKDFHINRSDSLVQPASIDLTVGEIYLPPDPEDDTSEAKKIEDSYHLRHGGTVMIKTREKLNLPANVGGLMFPKNGKFASKGLMITNFGHVDPGYNGHLRYTVINFGAEKNLIEVGQRITSLTLFELAEPADPSWSEIAKSDPASMKGHAKQLNRDFLDIDKRINASVGKAVENAVSNREKLRSITLPLLALGITTLIAITGLFMPFYFHLDSKIENLESKNKTIYQVKK